MKRPPFPNLRPRGHIAAVARARPPPLNPRLWRPGPGHGPLQTWSETPGRQGSRSLCRRAARRSRGSLSPGVGARPSACTPVRDGRTDGRRDRGVDQITPALCGGVCQSLVRVPPFIRTNGGAFSRPGGGRARADSPPASLMPPGTARRIGPEGLSGLPGNSPDRENPRQREGGGGQKRERESKAAGSLLRGVAAGAIHGSGGSRLGRHVGSLNTPLMFHGVTSSHARDRQHGYVCPIRGWS